jgi:hypothetical protein
LLPHRSPSDACPTSPRLLDGRPAPARLDDPVPANSKNKSDTKFANVSASTFPTQKGSGACPLRLRSIVDSRRSVSCNGGLKRSIVPLGQ